MVTKHKLVDLTDEEEAEIQRQIAADPDDAEATDEELAQARPFAEAFPELMAAIERQRDSSGSDASREAVTLRLQPETLAKFKAAGEDWRGKMAEALDRAEV